MKGRDEKCLFPGANEFRQSLLGGFRFIGLEREADYAEIARARIAFWATRPGAETAAVLRSVAAAPVGQESLFGEAAA